MRKPFVFFAVGVLVAAWQSASAQAPFPPPAVANAPSVQAAVAAIGAAQPIGSGHLLLDLPEVAVSGTVKGLARSLVPGTTLIYVFRTIPTAPKVAAKTGSKTAPQAPAQSVERKPSGAKPLPVPAAPPPVPTVLVAAKQVLANEDPSLPVEFEFDARESFSMFAFAQGKWFVTGREIKPATLLKPGSTQAQ